MQRLRKLLSQLLVVGATLCIASWGPALAMETELECTVPEIVKGYKQADNLEACLLTQLRDEVTELSDFRQTVAGLTPFLVQRVFECLEMQNVSVKTPVAQHMGTALANDVVLVTVLRSGDALLEGFRRYLPKAPVGKILVQRDENTAEAKFLYCKLPDRVNQGKKIVILEPMIATGGSLTLVIGQLLNDGILQKNIIVSSVVAAPEGLEALAQAFPEISVTVLAIDHKLNERKYIVPGLGDFGDRFYGTEEMT